MKTKYLFVMMLGLFFSATGFAQNRKPYAAGRFFSDNPADLRIQLQKFFLNAIPKKTEGSPLAIVVPHAGYVYSGQVAASGYNQIDPNQKFERIFLIGSSHVTTFPGASVYCVGNYETPLGTVPVDLELAKKLVDENKLLTFKPEAHATEHSLEVQLPFLQYYLKNDFKIVPVIIGSSTVETARKLAEIFKPYLNEKNLFVISSDFSHYPTYRDAQKADQLTAQAIAGNKVSGLVDALAANEEKNYPGLVTSLCGWSSVLTLLNITEKLPGIKTDLIQYQNSGDSSYGEKNRVVGYYSIAFSQDKSKEVSFSLSQTDKDYMLKLARETITQYVRNGATPAVDQSKLSETLKTPCGAFVTLMKDHKLRGCIGRFEPGDPLWKVVQSMAVAAATHDYRFEKVTSSEIPQLKVEISVLTPLRRIKSADEFTLGKQGIYMKKGNSSGTFLPQVAKETGWNKEEFLGHCAQDKAGIGWNGWKTAELYTYEALVFEEGE